MESAHVVVRDGRGLGMVLPLEEHRRALLALGERDLVRRVVRVGLRDRPAGADGELLRPEGEPGDVDVIGARLHEVLLLVRLVTLEARLVVGPGVELAVGGEARVLPLAVAQVGGILGAQPARFSMPVKAIMSPFTASGVP